MNSDKYQVIENWKEDILSEKDFFSLVKKSIPIVGNNTELRHFRRACLALYVIFIAIYIFKRSWFASSNDIQKFVEIATGSLIGVYASLLGFVLAGFAIIISMFSREVFLILAKVKKKDREVSEFKFIYFSFIYTLFVFGIGLFLSFFLFILTVEDGLVEVFQARAVKTSDVFLISLAFVVVGWFIYSLLLLKTLVWNLYQLVLTGLLTAKEKAE